MSEGPDNAIKDGIKIVLVQGKKCSKVEFDKSLQEAKEISSDFREAVEIAGDQRQTWGKDHFKQLSEEITIKDHV